MHVSLNPDHLFTRPSQSEDEWAAALEGSCTDILADPVVAIQGRLSAMKIEDVTMKSDEIIS